MTNFVWFVELDFSFHWMSIVFFSFFGLVGTYRRYLFIQVWVALVWFDLVVFEVWVGGVATVFCFEGHVFGWFWRAVICFGSEDCLWFSLDNLSGVPFATVPAVRQDWQH